MGGANIDPEAIIWMIFTRGHYITKYLGSRSCDFWQEDFLMFSYISLNKIQVFPPDGAILTLGPLYAGRSQ